MSTSELEAFMRDRDEALLSLDRDKLEAYFRKYDVPMPADDLMFWTAIHKARTAVTSLPADERKKSREWLAQHGFSHMSDEK